MGPAAAGGGRELAPPGVGRHSRRARRAGGKPPALRGGDHGAHREHPCAGGRRSAGGTRRAGLHAGSGEAGGVPRHVSPGADGRDQHLRRGLPARPPAAARRRPDRAAPAAARLGRAACRRRSLWLYHRGSGRTGLGVPAGDSFLRPAGRSDQSLLRRGTREVTEQKTVLSGMRSTGKIHLGNYFGALKNWIDLQDGYRCYYFAADWHALTTDYADPSQTAANTLEMVTDWLAAGLDPARSTIFIQSMVPDHAELHLLMSMITPLGWLERVPTYKEQIQQIENKDLHTYGFLGYPVLQTVDIAVYRVHFVPVGEDQASHLEISREIVRRFNYLYQREIFPEPRALFTPAAKVPGIDGRKMSKSYGNAINLSDSPDEIRKKCMQMFTDPQRIKRSDPGRPEVCNLYDFHKLVSTPEVQERVACDCRAATIGCVDDKKLLAQTLIDYLEPMRRRREELLRDRDTIYDILLEGSKKARERTAETMEQVRGAMGLDYRKALALAEKV